MKKYVFLILILCLVLIILTGYSNQIKKGGARFSVNERSTASVKFIPPKKDAAIILSVQQNSLDKEYTEAMNAARKLFKEPIATPPSPPDINLKCTEEGAMERLGDVYYKAVVQPEEPVCERLLSAAKQLRLASEAAEEKAKDAIDIAGLLFKRNFKKVDTLIRAYKPDPNKLVAVGYASLRIYKEAALLGVQATPPLDVFGDWAAKAADQYLRELYTNHDYKAISAFIELTKQAKLLGISESSYDFFEKMQRALAFKVDFDVSCYMSAGEQKMTLKGSVKLTADSTLLAITGEGSGDYVSYTHAPTKAKTTLDLANNGYSVFMRLLEFKPCEGSVKLYVDKIGSDTEKWYNPASGKRFTAPSEDVDLFVKMVTDKLFQEYNYKGGGGGFNFTIPIQNLQVQMCNSNFTQTGTIDTPDGSVEASITYNITITHTPN